MNGQKNIMKEAMDFINQFYYIIISDYAKGTISKTLIKIIRELMLTKTFQIYIDPKPSK